MNKMTQSDQTGKLGLASEYFTSFNIRGITVEIRKVEHLEFSKKTPIRMHFCAYAELENSHILSDSFLGFPTFRKDDWVGVDTAHCFNEGQSEAEKLVSAIHQIDEIILIWKGAIE